MPRPLDITQRQALALMKAAKEAGCAVEYDPATGKMVFLPVIPEKHSPSKKELDEHPEIRL